MLAWKRREKINVYAVDDDLLFGSQYFHHFIKPNKQFNAKFDLIFIFDHRKILKKY